MGWGPQWSCIYFRVHMGSISAALCSTNTVVLRGCHSPHTAPVFGISLPLEGKRLMEMLGVVGIKVKNRRKFYFQHKVHSGHTGMFRELSVISRNGHVLPLRCSWQWPAGDSQNYPGWKRLQDQVELGLIPSSPEPWVPGAADGICSWRRSSSSPQPWGGGMFIL